MLTAREGRNKQLLSSPSFLPTGKKGLITIIEKRLPKKARLQRSRKHRISHQLLSPSLYSFLPHDIRPIQKQIWKAARRRGGWQKCKLAIQVGAFYHFEIGVPKTYNTNFP